MSAEPIEVVQKVYQAFAERDLPSIFRLFSTEVELAQSSELPWGGEYRGHDGFREFLTKLTAHVNSKVEFERFIRSGEHVTAIGWTHGTVVANGAKFRVPIAHVWKVRDDLVTAVRFYIDNPLMLAALAQQPTST